MTDKKTKIERIIEVEWEDTASTHGWQQHEDMPETWIIYSVGYVDRDDESGIRLYEARSISDTSGQDRGKRNSRDYGCASMIPRSAIRKVIELKRTR